MRVAQICPTFFGESSVIGGAERYVLELSRKMSRRTEVGMITFSVIYLTSETVAEISILQSSIPKPGGSHVQSV